MTVIKDIPVNPDCVNCRGKGFFSYRSPVHGVECVRRCECTYMFVDDDGSLIKGNEPAVNGYIYCPYPVTFND